MMPTFLENTTVSNENRQIIIQAYPCFSDLTSFQSRELAKLMQEVSYLKGENIVTEDEIVDSVYFIINGKAEVTRQVEFKRKRTTAVIAILQPYESIGLNDTGFYSSTGKRTATVTALSDLLLLRIDLKDLHTFLQKYHLESSMYQAAEQMLRMRLIKMSLPFSQLSYERLHWLSECVEEMSVMAGTIIFHQGDKGDQCYLIRSGQVEIIATEQDGSSHQLGILKSPTLFGEATLITQATRNATARALEDCTLLVLSFEHLTELLEQEQNVANMLMTLMVDRSRPLRNPQVVEYPRITPEGRMIVILKNPDTLNYFKLSQEGWFIWQQLNGQQTVVEITIALANQFQVFNPNKVVALISKLTRAGLVLNVSTEKISREKTSAWEKWFLRLRQLLEIRIVFRDSDPWLTNIYNKIVHLLFTRLGQLLLAVLTISGMVVFIATENHVVHLLQTLQQSWLLFVFMLPLLIFTVSLHELGHAFVTKSFGHEVHSMGVGWYWTGPIAFTDTTDMWLDTRWRRMAVNIAGIYTNAFVAGLSALLILVVPSLYGQAFLWLFALVTYINGFSMLNPLQEMDGYYILMDLFDHPRLRHSAILWLINKFPTAIKTPSLFLKHGAEAGYWIACIVFLISIVLITLYVQGFILKLLGMHPANPFVALFLPLSAAILSSLTIISDIRKEKD